MPDADRTLTDADVEAIVASLKSQLVSDFYGEVGRGVWYWCKKAFMGIVLLMAIYGMAKEVGLAVLPPQVRQ